MGRNKMKASKLIQDLARQIAEHGDLSVTITINTERNKHYLMSDTTADVKSAMIDNSGQQIEIYGEE